MLFKVKKTLDKFESVSGLHITARQLILMFVAFYALILHLFAHPDAQFYTLWAGGESIAGPGPTRGTGNSNTGLL